jgi:2'-hydroxyisoflavone reductase
VKLLLLGGPKFVGLALIEASLARGHEVTTFNRGQTNPGAFPEVEELHGDRHGDLEALQGRSWDAVLDTSAYVPQVVRSAAGLLADSVERYMLVSSISVYADYSRPTPEDAPLEVLAEGHPDDELLPDYANYGPLKVLCEQAVEERFPGRALIVRPGLIVGPNDPTDRFTYWPRRVELGRPLLAPAPANGSVQLVDVRDLAEWIVRMVEDGEIGALNATSPDGMHSWESMLAACGATDVLWVDEAFLLERGVEPWRDLPLWIPAGDPEMAYFHRTDVSKAVAAGLTFRSLEETARDVPEWNGTAGISPARETELLDEWAKVAV